MLNLGPLGNRILRALPQGDYDRFVSSLEEVHLSHGQILCEPDEFFSHVYFIDNGVASSVTLLANGDSVEAATVGREGMVGLSVFLGGRSPTQFIMQVPDGGSRMSSDAFRSHLDSSPAMRTILGLYANAYMAQLAQSSACNAAHNTNERCARWLLATHDRGDGGDELELTQDFLATMLGVHRPTVTLAVGTLQQAGLIRYRRGHVTIADREGLESASCECYAVSAGRFDSVFDDFPARPA